MPFIIGGAILGGAALSAGSGAMGAAAANRAGRQARDRYASETSIDMNRLGYSVYGPSWDDLVVAGDYQNYSPQQREEATQRYLASTGGSVIGQQQRLVNDFSGRGGQQLRRFDSATGRLAGQAGTNADQLRMLYEGDLAPTNAAISKGYGQVTQGWDDYIKGVGGQLKGWGQGRESIIDQDFSRANKAADDTAQAQLAASGMGGTLAAQQLAGNAERFGREKARAKQDLSEAQIDRQTTIPAQLFAQRQGAAERGAAAQAQNTASILYGRRGAVGDAMNTQLARGYGRESERLGLEDTGINREIGLRQLPMNTMLSVQQGNVMNPWLGMDTTKYYPGYSPAANAAGSLGNAAALYGFSQMQQQPGSGGYGGGGGQVPYQNFTGPVYPGQPYGR